MLAGFGDGVPAVFAGGVAPTACSAATAAGNGAVVELMTATFLPASEVGSEYDAPVSAPSTVAASATVRVIGPAASCALATPSTPSVETRPTVGLSATTPAAPAGAMICAVSGEVSSPKVSAARPSAVDAALPAAEPAGVLSVSDGSSTCPPSEE